MKLHPPTGNIHLVKPHDKSCDQCDAFHQCICANIDPQVADKIKPLSVQRGPFLAGDFLVRQNEKFRSFYLIQSGVLRSETASYNGRRKVKWFYFPGDLIGMEAVSGNKWPADIAVIKKTCVCEISASEFTQAAQRYPQIQNQLFRRFGERILNQEYSLATDFSEAATARVLEYLLLLHDRLQSTEFVSGSQIVLPMTKTELASYLGMSPETLSRILKKLEAAGLINNQLQSIDLRNRSRLAESLEYTQR